MTRFKEHRESLGITLKEYADRAGTSPSQIRGWEANVSISVARLEVVAKALNVHPAWLAGWIEEADVAKPEVETKIVTKVVERKVYVAAPDKLPSYYQPDAGGNVIKWKERGGQ